MTPEVEQLQAVLDGKTDPEDLHALYEDEESDVQAGVLPDRQAA